MRPEDYITREEFGAHNYHPPPVVLEKGRRICVGRGRQTLF